MTTWVPPAHEPIPEMNKLVAAEWSRTRFDIVIASTGAMISYATLAPPGTPLILEVHNLMSRWMRNRIESQKSVKEKTIRWLGWNRTRLREARDFRKFSRVVLVSDIEHQEATRTLPGVKAAFLTTIPNGVDCQNNTPKYTGFRSGSMVYNGSLTYQANYNAVQHFLNDIFPRIKQAVPEATLTISGSYGGADLSGLNLSDDVFLTGLVDDIRPVVQDAAMCVIPIRIGGGTRLKILEAMALGTPVLSTSKGAEGLKLVDGKHLIIADDPRFFAQQAVMMLGNPEIGEKLARNARHHVEENYDWPKIGRQFINLVQEVVRENGP